MSATPLRASLMQLLDKDFARRMPEVPIRFAQAGSGAAETQKIRVTHFGETRPHFFELEWLESYGAHGLVSDVF